VSTNASVSASSSSSHWKHFDYRFEANPSIFKSNFHPNDCSINTLVGPLILQTLIRATFSPLETTGGRFICSGSSDGNVYIYDVLTGELVDRLGGHRAVVRDVSWHPTQPLISSASWDGCVKLWGFDSNLNERQGAKQWRKDKEQFQKTKTRVNREEEEEEEEDDNDDDEDEDEEDDDEEEEEEEEEDDDDEEEEDENEDEEEEEEEEEDVDENEDENA
jgi:WD40 repeat protein